MGDGPTGAEVEIEVMVNLVKLAVRVESVEHLQGLQKLRVSQNNGVLRHLTRNTPKRVQELLPDGSIYWVIKGFIMVRQKILQIVELPGSGQRFRCAIVLDPELVPVELTPHRPFQGWRYLEKSAVPRDLPERSSQKDSVLPTDLAAELRELGLI